MIPSSEASAIELIDVSCSRTGVDGRTSDSLRQVSAAFFPRSFSLVTGPSVGERGLLLRLLSLAETPDAGDVLLAGASISALGAEARAELRARKLGLVFSSPFLLPAFSAIENIAMPLFKMEQMEPDDARQRAEEALEFAGLAGLEQARGEELNAFQQHCASLARALAARPAVLLVEELDCFLASDSLPDFTALLRRAAERFGLAVIATGSPAYCQTAGSARRILLEGGCVAHDSNAVRESPL